MLEVALSAAATLVALAATLSIFDRWLTRRQGHQIAWASAFALFTIASGALALGAGIGWNGPLFRIFYLLGAILNVPVLALGTVLLLGKARSRRLALWGVVGFCLFASGVLVATPFTDPVPVDRLARGSEILPVLPRLLAALASTLATLVVVGGAIRSAIRFRSLDGGGRRAVGNVLIALGVIVTGASGLANSLLGDMGAFALFLAIGVAVILAGYLVTTTGADATTASPPGGSSTGAGPTPGRNGAPTG